VTQGEDGQLELREVIYWEKW